MGGYSHTQDTREERRKALIQLKSTNRVDLAVFLQIEQEILYFLGVGNLWVHMVYCTGCVCEKDWRLKFVSGEIITVQPHVATTIKGYFLVFGPKSHE